jgi:cytidylate kinase
MNIIEVYSKYKNGIIILFSGLEGSGKHIVATNIADKFNMEILNTNNFIKKDYTNLKTIDKDNNIQVNDIDNIDAYDWKLINEKVDEYINNIFNGKNGIIIISRSFVDSLLNFKYNFHINVKISKNTFIEKREEYVRIHPEKNIDIKTEYLIINKLIFPQYIEYLEKTHVDKYLNANTLSTEELFDQTFDYLIYEINKFLKDNKIQVDIFLKKLKNGTKNMNNNININNDNINVDNNMDNNMDVAEVIDNNIDEDIDNNIDEDIYNNFDDEDTI